MSLPLLLTMYCVLIAGAAIAGGLVPLWLRVTHTRMQLALSFVGGMMLGVALLHMLPHAVLGTHSMQTAVNWTLAGFLAMFFIERVFHFHHHDAPVDAAEHEHHHAHEHGHAHEHDHAPSPAPSESARWPAVLAGLALHSMLDGVALAAAVAVEAEEHPQRVLWGLTVFLVVVLHKPFDSLTLGTLMTAGGRSHALQLVVTGLYALSVPTGVVLFFLGVHDTADAPAVIGAALAFAAGMFLCIATSDLLPELQFHTHDRLKLSAALLLGIALAAALVQLEEHGHAHEHHEAMPHGHPH